MTNQTPVSLIRKYVEISNHPNPQARYQEWVMSDDEIKDHWRHLQYHYDATFNGKILELTPENKARFFQMIHDYADLWEILVPPGSPFVENALGKLGQAARDNPHDGIDWEYECPIVKEYDEWLASKNNV